MQKNWKVQSKILPELLSNYPNVDPFLAQLLYNRGLIEPHQIEEFLHPEYERLHSPFLFKDMQRAVDRIWQAIEKREKICIYGDYDADAITANVVLLQTLKVLGMEGEYYIPDRFSEGYGVNLDALEKIKNQGVKLIITVDCGTNSLDAVEWCKNNHVDLIITDHHEIIGEAPKALALINPKNPSDEYPDQEITGVGVAFKLACGILKNQKSKIKNQNFMEGWEKWLLDLVAIGTVADCHKLLGENRILVKYGLIVLAKTKWVGLKALAITAGLDFEQHKPDTYTLGFVLAPRLNATGRLEHAGLAVDLLLCSDAVVAQQSVMAIEQINRKRQETTALILSEAREKALMLKDKPILAIMNANWHKGVVGLVAGKLAEEFYKPTFILSQTLTEATGSARTVGSFNVISALSYSAKYLVRYGGHKQAAGLTLVPDNFENFYFSLLEYANSNLLNEDSSPVLELEAELLESQLSIVNCQLLSQLEPFGVGNLKPKFLISSAEIISQRPVGTNKQHLQMQIKVGQKEISAIAFNFTPVELKGEIDIAGELLLDEWNGRKNLKLRVIDIRSHLIT
jgi:single-stranded-DNA-specific exonuclease